MRDLGSTKAVCSALKSLTCGCSEEEEREAWGGVLVTGLAGAGFATTGAGVGLATGFGSGLVDASGLL